MRGYFEGDKNVLVFKPIHKVAGGRKKKQSRFDRIRNGTEEDVVDELEKVIEWAWKLPKKQREAIINSNGGLRQFIRDVMEHPCEQ